MYNKLTVEDVDVKGKKVLVRCDFNVPLDADGNITDENRIVGALPTIKYLIDNGARVILCSHMGKPKGEPVPSLSLAPVAKSLSEKLGKEVVFAADDNVVGDNAKKAVAEMNDGDVVLLQNTRYRKEETKNEEAFSKELASLADLFVNDAFGTAHRAHCSNVGVSSILKPAVAGYLIEKEINFLGNAVNNPVRPLVAILGGSKVSSKISVIENLLKKVDKLIIGLVLLRGKYIKHHPAATDLCCEIRGAVNGIDLTSSGIALRHLTGDWEGCSGIDAAAAVCGIQPTEV